jgi:hypothetical protein
VKGSTHLFAAQARDYPLDLPPVAEARDVAVVSAAFRTNRSFISRIVAKAFHEVGGISQRETSMDERSIHGRASNRAALSRLPTNVVNKSLTMFPVPEGGADFGLIAGAAAECMPVRAP